MMNKKTKKAQTNEEANREYWEHQTPLNLWFKSPFRMLNHTLEDCYKQRTEMGVSDADFERDKATFTTAIKSIVTEHGCPDTNEKVDHVLSVAYSFVRGAMTKPDMPENYWPLVACHAALIEVHDAQQKKGFIVDAAMTNVALFGQHMMSIAWKPERMRSLEQLAANQHALANEQQATNRILNEANKGLAPLAKKGAKFKPGKPKGALSPLAEAVKNHLVKQPTATPDEVWLALARKPPSGLVFMDTPRLGRYVEDAETGKTIAAFPAFRNHVSRRRPTQ
jgi:hypothetical protein